MIIKRNIFFFVQKVKDQDSGPIRMKIRFNGQDVVFNVGFSCPYIKWDNVAKRMRRNTTNLKQESAYEINNEISRLEMLAESVFKKYEVLGIVPSKADYKRSFNKSNGGETNKIEDKKPISWYITQFCQETGKNNGWATSTYRRFYSLMNYLKKFRPDIQINDFDKGTLNKYTSHLIDSRLANATVLKEIKLLKWFLRWAFENNYTTISDFESFAPKLKVAENKVIFLTWEELIKMYNFDFSSKPYLQTARDIFCFCCFTSLRYSDVYNLKKADIKDGYIEVTTVKTTDRLIIDLNKYSRSIIDKYKDFQGEKAFPVTSNQKMNKFIKEVAYVVGIDELVTTTCFRGSERIEEVHPK